MAVQDDLRRQLDSIYLGKSLNNFVGSPVMSTTDTPVTIWYKGRLQQANDGNWIFRSISPDGTIVGVQLGSVNSLNWLSDETPSAGVTVTIQIYQHVLNSAGNNSTNSVSAGYQFLKQQLPQELTN